MHLWDNNEERKRVHEDLNSRYSGEGNAERQKTALLQLFVYMVVLLICALLFKEFGADISSFLTRDLNAK